MGREAKEPHTGMTKPSARCVFYSPQENPLPTSPLPGTGSRNGRL